MVFSRYGGNGRDAWGRGHDVTFQNIFQMRGWMTIFLSRTHVFVYLKHLMGSDGTSTSSFPCFNKENFGMILVIYWFYIYCCWYITAVSNELLWLYAAFNSTKYFILPIYRGQLQFKDKINLRRKWLRHWIHSANTNNWLNYERYYTGRHKQHRPTTHTNRTLECRNDYQVWFIKQPKI